MSRVQSIIAASYGREAGELTIGGRPVRGLVDEFSSPLFVYDRSVLERTWTRLRAAIPKKVELFYSVKANPNRDILEFFVNRGAGLEVASGGELDLSLRAGTAPQRILFAGPGKSDSELEAAVSLHIGEVHVESLREAERLAAIAARQNRSVEVAIRVNPGPQALGGAIRMGGKPAVFGIDEEELQQAVERIRAQPTINLCGLHLYVGTQILDARVLLGQYRHAFEIARRVGEWNEKPLTTLDLGGGLGVPYFSNETELDIELLGEGIDELVRAASGEAAFRGTRFLLEPGRYLVAEAGIYLARVVDVKISRGKKFVVLDGGMNHHLAASGNLGQVIRRNFPIAVVNRLDEPDRETVDLVGPLCTPLDVLGRDVSLPRVEEGDLVGVFQSGAYGRSASPLDFLSRPHPAEVLVCDGEARLIGGRRDVGD